MIQIVIPAYNEKENIRPLIARIEAVCKLKGLQYEILFVDDTSTDGTKEEIQSLQKDYPIIYIPKKGERGKAQSLLLGFSHATSDIVVMIDADLQYPPEAIPDMVEMIKQDKADIVVSKRTQRETSVLRSFASTVYHSLFVNLLLHLPYDTQSGLKAIRRSVLTHIQPTGKGFLFDLDFLYHAREAGYRIASYTIVFHERFKGKAKVSLLKTSLSLAANALKIKFTGKPIIPFSIEQEQKDGQGFRHKGKEFVSHTRLPIHKSAYLRMNTVQIAVLVGLIALLVLSFLLSWHATLVVLISLLTILYSADFLFQAYLVYRSFTSYQEIQIEESAYASVPDSFWPVYTIFCPLYKEWHVLPQFIRAMTQLDYPKDKLQVMLLLEEDDKDSIEHIKTMALPDFFEVKIVPHSKPKTKPKALNYGLRFTKGTYAVIYDAEDIPDPHQLKKSVIAFTKVDASTVCLQAKLNFYNPHQNLLTRLFTAEYSLWFDLILPGLQSLKAPIPLGGTSNHFKTQALYDIGGWDAFNVTEDCDVGMRLSKHKLHTAILDSTTMEEANSKLWNWYGQRSRWIKGYIQTYLVHARDLQAFQFHRKRPDALLFQLVVGGKVLSLFINPFMWIITILYFTFRATLGPTIESFFVGPVFYLAVFSLVFGNFLYVYIYMIGCVKRGYFDLIKYVLITPLYWLFMSAAAWKALIEMVYKPFYWSKTVHGFHLAPEQIAVKHKKAVKKKHTSFQHALGSYTKPHHKKPYSSLPPYCDILHVA